MIIEYEARTNKFLIQCQTTEMAAVMKLPDRRFRKASRKWGVPVLRRNVEHMHKHMFSQEMYTPEAWTVITEQVNKPKNINEGVPSWFEFKNPPMKHQAIAMDKAYPQSEYALFFEQGLGKTFTAINLAALWRMKNDIQAVVEVCHTSIQLVWEEELQKHCPIPTQVHALMAGKNKAAEHFIGEQADFPWFCVGVEALSQGGAHKLLERFLLARKCLFIIDESSRIKTPNKTRTDRCITYGKLAAKRLILSGTSVTQGVQDLYTQYGFLDKNIIGFDSFFSFRAQYCEVISMEVQQDKWVDKIVGNKNEDELISLINPVTSRVEKKDALDLPEKVFQTRNITMGPAQKKLYEEMKNELFAEMDGVEYEVKTVLEQTLRLQQITGGFYPHDDGEKVTPRPIPGKNPKLTELMSVMDEVQGKVVIWCQFRAEIELIADAMRKTGIPHVEFHGGCDDLEKKFAVQSFRRDPETRVFLATRAAAYGLTLVESSTAIYFSQGYSLEEYSQSQDRIHRIGQKDSCLYIHLNCTKTIDVIVGVALRNKQNVASMIYNAMMEGDI